MIRNRWLYPLMVVLIALSMGLAACGDDDKDNDQPPDSPPPAGDNADVAPPAAGDGTLTGAARGEQLFSTEGCTGCHAIASEDELTGPSLKGVALVAGSRVDGLDAAAYLRQSIVEPNAYAVEGFNPIMPLYPAFTDQDISDIVAYLLTLDE